MSLLPNTWANKCLSSVRCILSSTDFPRAVQITGKYGVLSWNMSRPSRSFSGGFDSMVDRYLNIASPCGTWTGTEFVDFEADYYWLRLYLSRSSRDIAVSCKYFLVFLDGLISQWVQLYQLPTRCGVFRRTKRLELLACILLLKLSVRNSVGKRHDANHQLLASRKSSRKIFLCLFA